MNTTCEDLNAKPVFLLKKNGRQSALFLTMTLINNLPAIPFVLPKTTYNSPLKITPTRHLLILQLRLNGCDGVSNHQPHDCFLNRLFRRRSTKASKLRVTGLCVGNSPVTICFHLMTSSWVFMMTTLSASLTFVRGVHSSLVYSSLIHSRTSTVQPLKFRNWN